MKKKLLELFAGSRSVGMVAERLGMEVFSVDWSEYDGIDLKIDIGTMKLSDVPFIPDVVWASPDCATYSIAACSHHRNTDKSPKSEYAIKCDEVNRHWIKLIGEWLLINPNMVFFIENPRGNLRHMDFMQKFKRHTVWYCQYGDDRAKPTDIWTNSTDWIPKPECHNYKYDPDGEVINRHCHHESARRGAKTGTQGRSGSYERSRIPEKLCFEVVKSCLIKQYNDGEAGFIG